MRIIKNESDYKNKFGDTNTVFRLNLYDDVTLVDTTNKSLKMNIANDKGLVLSKDIKTDYSGYIAFDFSDESIQKLTPDNYLLEIELPIDGEIAKYPTIGGLGFVVTKSLNETTGELVNTITFDEVLKSVDDKIAVYMETVKKGDKGDTGEKGQKGDKGDTGEQGKKGDKGDTGEKGDRGTDGVTPDVSINNYNIDNNDDPFYLEPKTPFYDFYVKKLIEMNKKINDDTFNIGFLTDNHYQLGDYSPNALQHYSQFETLTRMNGNIDVEVLGGDNINGDVQLEFLKAETEAFTSIAFGRAHKETDVFMLLGNHDTGVGQSRGLDPSKNLTYADIKKYYKTENNLYSETRNDGSLYGYKDYPKNKVRVVFLNSFDVPDVKDKSGMYKYSFINTSAYGNDQLNWLANTALNIEDGWHVIIFTHAPISGTFLPSGSLQYNGDSFLGILTAFKNGTAYTSKANTGTDFAVDINANFNKRGTIVAIVSGHVHADGIKSINGINCVQTDASLCYAGDIGKGRIKGTEAEDVWDIFKLNTTNKHVDILRFGHGTDRSFDY